MSARRSFLLRVHPAVLDAVQRWANDDLRSLNGQIEFLLRKALKDGGRDDRGGASRAPVTPPPTASPQAAPPDATDEATS